MDGIIWLFSALIVALVALGVVLAGLRRRPSEVNNSSHCPNCETPMSLRRVSLFRSRTLMGQWVCPHCGKFKSGKRATGTAA